MSSSEEDNSAPYPAGSQVVIDPITGKFKIKLLGIKRIHVQNAGKKSQNSKKKQICSKKWTIIHGSRRYCNTCGCSSRSEWFVHGKPLDPEKEENCHCCGKIGMIKWWCMSCKRF